VGREVFAITHFGGKCAREGRWRLVRPSIVFINFGGDGQFFYNKNMEMMSREVS